MSSKQRTDWLPIVGVIGIITLGIGVAWAAAWSEVQEKRIESNERIALARTQEQESPQ